MSVSETLAQIKDWVVEPDLLSLAAQVQPAMQGNAQAQQQVSGALLWAAFAAPAAVTAVYDAIAAGNQKQQPSATTRDFE